MNRKQSLAWLRRHQAPMIAALNAAGLKLVSAGRTPEAQIYYLSNSLRVVLWHTSDAFDQVPPTISSVDVRTTFDDTTPYYKPVVALVDLSTACTDNLLQFMHLAYADLEENAEDARHQVDTIEAASSCVASLISDLENSKPDSPEELFFRRKFETDVLAHHPCTRNSDGTYVSERSEMQWQSYKKAAIRFSEEG